MARSLLFIPDISGYTKFIQNTELSHSQHVIAELLEVLIAANALDIKLAEVEGDALFFYSEGTLPSQEQLLAQMEIMFAAFYSHLKLLEKNRICPCNACATAPQLELKMIAHVGDIQMMEVQGNKKPFGNAVIEAHRLLKNSIDSDKYALISDALRLEIGMPVNYESKLFSFEKGVDSYDDSEILYHYSKIDTSLLKLSDFSVPRFVTLNTEPNLSFEREFLVSGAALLETITNYRYRHLWHKDVDAFEFPENEITRWGSEHTCVIDGKHFNFVTVTKEAAEDEIVYGECTTSPPPVDELYQFFVISKLTENSCRLRVEMYWKARSPFKKLMIALVAKNFLKKGMIRALDGLEAYVKQQALVA